MAPATATRRAARPRRRRPAARHAVAAHQWTGPDRRAGCWAGRMHTPASFSPRWVERRRGWGQLRLRDDVVRRGSDRVIRRHNEIPRLGVAALAGNDEHRRRACALTVQEQLSAVADVEQPGRPGIGRTARAPTRQHGEDREQHAERSPHKATLHRQPTTRSTIAISGRVPCVMAARALSGDDTSSTTAAASIDPVPAKMSAHADGVIAESTDHDANHRDDGQEQVVEALVERQLLGGLRLLLGDTERRARARATSTVSDSITKM